MLKLAKYVQGKTHVIWDWNGTLLDDVEMVVNAMGRVASEHGLKAPTVEEYAKIFGFPVFDYYRKLGFDFQKTTFEAISEKFVEHYMAGVLSCDLHSGARELLQELKDAGVSQSVLSAAYEPALKEHLKHFKIAHFFDRVFGLSDHEAKGKIERGLELVAVSGHAAADTILIGDTDHDLEVGKALGVDVLLLADGHQSYERLIQIHSLVVEDRHAP